MPCDWLYCDIGFVAVVWAEATLSLRSARAFFGRPFPLVLSRSSLDITYVPQSWLCVAISILLVRVSVISKGWVTFRTKGLPVIRLCWNVHKENQGILAMTCRMSLAEAVTVHGGPLSFWNTARLWLAAARACVLTTRHLCPSYPSQAVLYLSCRKSVLPVFRSFSATVFLYVVVVLACPLEEVSWGSHYSTTLNHAHYLPYVKWKINPQGCSK